MITQEKKKLTEEDLKNMKNELMGRPALQMPQTQPQMQRQDSLGNSLNQEREPRQIQEPMRTSQQVQEPSIKKPLPRGLIEYQEKRRMLRQQRQNPQQTEIQDNPQTTQRDSTKTGLTKTQFNQIIEDNKNLTEQMSLIQTKMSLRNQEEFSYQMLLITSQIVMTLQEIRKELNSISLQIYDSNKIAAGVNGEVIEETQEQSIPENQEMMSFDAEPDYEEDEDLDD